MNADIITWPGYKVLIASLFKLLNWEGVTSNFRAIFGRVSYAVTWRDYNDTISKYDN